MKTIPTILLILILLQIDLYAQDVKWSINIEESLLESVENNKPVLIYFGADWCMPCKLIERNVLKSKEFLEYSKVLNLVKVYDDFKEGEIDKYDKFISSKDQYHISHYPTFIIIKDGQEVGRISQSFVKPLIFIRTVKSYL